MSDSVIITANGFPDPESLALVADMQFREPYSSAAINRKLRGLALPGIYSGFNPTPGTGLNVLISSGNDGGTCSFNIGKYYQQTVRQQADVTISMAAGTTKIIVLQTTYALGTETYQVNSASTVQAAEIVLLDATATLADNQLELCKVTIPSGTTQITSDMIDLSGRVARSLTFELSSAIDSDEEEVAANSLAVKKAIAYLVDSAPDALNTLSLLAKALNNDPDFHTTIDTALGKKMAIAQNGADINDKATFLKNLGLGTHLDRFKNGFFPQATGGVGDVDLNTITTAGVYLQNYSAKALSSANYPTADAGAIVVYWNASSSTAGSTGGCTQEYYPYNSNNMYRRYYLNSIWSVWVKVPTLADFASSLATSGYQKLPTGMILQWGQVSVPANSTSGVKITFPTTFPSSCTGAWITDIPDNTSGYYFSHMISKNASSCMCGIYGATNINGAINIATIDLAPCWMAIGY